MGLLPRITKKARELIVREFDARGPDACMAEIIEHLERHNPELLDMAAKLGADLEGHAWIWHVLSSSQSGSPGTSVLTQLPRVSEEKRTRLVREIDEKGTGNFKMDAIAELEQHNSSARCNISSG